MLKNLCALVLTLISAVSGFSQMPLPMNVKYGEGQFKITSAFSIAASSTTDDKILEDAVNRLLVRIKARTAMSFKQETVVLNEKHDKSGLQISVKNKASMTIGVDESYQLVANAERVELTSNTTIGALRGIETLFQLIAADANGYFITACSINDAPRFKWRGMMVDVSRHFLPMSILKKHVEAMAMVKLNVLHLHLTDDDGFRVESKIYPKLHEMGSNGRYYTQTELKDLVKFASDRGMIVVPEFDLPGHTRSWLAGYPEFASQPGPYKPGPRFQFDENAKQADLMKAVMSGPTPTIDPTKEEVYKFLEKFFGEMASIFPAPYLHIGADENNGAAWNANTKIVEFMKAKGMKDTHQLQSYFVKRLDNIVKKLNRTTIAWQEAYSDELPKDVIIQAWIAAGGFMKAVPPLEIAEKGNPVLISTGSYLDLFLPSHVHYLNPNIPAEVSKNVLGGEAALWAEIVDENSFETRAWPRAASVAERLWSPASATDVDDMYRRLYPLSDRLEEMGLDHRLNIRRMLSQLSNGVQIDDALTIVETLAPFKGYRRLAGTMVQPMSSKYETNPLAGLQDLVEVDSEMEWALRKNIALFLTTKDQVYRNEIKVTLQRWKDASAKLSKQVQEAPGLKNIEAFSQRLSAAADIGLQALEGSFDEARKAEAIKQLRSMKLPTDIVEIRTLDEIEALVNGKLDPLPTTYSAF